MYHRALQQNIPVARMPSAMPCSTARVRQRARVGGVRLAATFFCVLLGYAGLSARLAVAQQVAEPLHPPIPLLDEDGAPVVDSGRPVSTMQSCGQCHDTMHIAEHCYHATLGLEQRGQVGDFPDQHPWDYAPGGAGRWNPLLYRFLTPPGDEDLDLGLADWIRNYGWRHVGGGPAVTGFGTARLDAGEPPRAGAVDSQTHVLDPQTWEPVRWDWRTSGVVELDCFLCHLKQPDNQARIAQLQEGRFAWANTAILQQSGVVAPEGVSWRYAAEQFDDDGSVSAETLGLTIPSAENCGQCHGQVHVGDDPLVLELSLRQWSLATKGQVFSAQRISESGANIQGKEKLSRPWDVHAMALMECRSCHFSLDNPALQLSTEATSPDHLRFDPRRLPIGEYLVKPSHDFAKGATAQGHVADYLAGTMRTCRDCHDAESTHGWLPYQRVHFNRLECEACHVPRSEAPALEAVDWTLIDPAGEPRTQWRGVEGEPHDPVALVTGFTPPLLPRKGRDGRVRLAPYNLVAAWYWVTNGEVRRPVQLADLQSALLEEGGYHPDVLAALDSDNDGRLNDHERVLDSEEKVAAVRARLEAVGVEHPRLAGELLPFGMHHSVSPAKHAVRDCDTCHARNSRLGEPISLGLAPLVEEQPGPPGDAHLAATGELRRAGNGRLVLDPRPAAAGYYVLGHDRAQPVNLLGFLAVLAVCGAVAVHAGLRIRSAMRSVSGGANRSATAGASHDSDDSAEEHRS